MDLKKRNVERMVNGYLADHLKQLDPQVLVERFDELYGVAFDSTEARVNRLLDAIEARVEWLTNDAEKLEGE